MPDPYNIGFIAWLQSAMLDESVFAAIPLQIILIVLCVLHSKAIGSLKAASLNEIRKRASDDNKKAVRALKMLENEDKHMKRFRTGRMISCSAGIMVFTVLYNSLVTRSVILLFSYIAGNTDAELNYYLIWSICITILLFFIFSVIFAVFGCILPERKAAELPEKCLIKNSQIFALISKINSPVTSFSYFLTDIIYKNKEDNTEFERNNRTEEEILMMVDEGEESGAIEGNTKDMIENVFDFNDTRVGEIMTHRKDVIAVKIGTKITDAAKTAIKSGKSRLPVYGEDTDDIVGMLYVKDLLKYVSTNAPSEKIGKNIIKEAVFVPESKRCSEMFESMTNNKTQIAVVVDEFGGTSGIITMEDLIESIVGSIQDEYDNEDEEIKKLDDRRFTVAGTTALDEISGLTGIDFEDENNDTIAGLMLDRIGHIPKNGEHPSIIIDNTRFTVQSVERRRISRVLIVIM